ncbi:COMM domain-containing protein 10 [Strongylocentrotus purpuratus]|uniref:COMM domain-containing protein n=1 Tax=Strongylocentrotus purpuratus TaxID=7668 RepID=A0A7M7TG80_STRPU|nr:COMM domain-containing protein 10 [Strongylocentrotus purpuratus]|eukprot:XP_011683633.1 PREDICTED: COMM domain-containing protein 10 isoform X2 [Strongylocentrotus purpuratus]
MALILTETASIKKAVGLINEIDSSKFPRLLQRIIQKLHLRDELSFTEDEEEKLEDALGMQRNDLELVLETTAFILEQAAYHLTKPANLSQQLQSIHLAEEKVSLFTKAWTSLGKDVVEKLRKRTLSPNQLTDVNWRLNLQMSQQNQTKLKMPNAMLELGITTDHGDKDRIRMEFTHEELFAFYNQLETVQGQLDSLS